MFLVGWNQCILAQRDLSLCEKESNQAENTARSHTYQVMQTTKHCTDENTVKKMIWKNLRFQCYWWKMNEIYVSSRKWDSIPGQPLAHVHISHSRVSLCFLLGPEDWQISGVSCVTPTCLLLNSTSTKNRFLLNFFPLYFQNIAKTGDIRVWDMKNKASYTEEWGEHRLSWREQRVSFWSSSYHCFHNQHFINISFCGDSTSPDTESARFFPFTTPNSRCSG